MKGYNAIGLIALLLVSVLSVMTPAHAALDSLGVSVNDVKVNGDSLNANQALKTEFQKDGSMDVKVQLQTDNSTSASNVEVTVFLTGSKDEISDTSKPFDVQPNTIYTKQFSLTVPQRTQSQSYQLRVVVASPNSNTLSFIYPIDIASVDHSVVVKDVTLSPNDKVIAGRAMTSIVRVKNYGQKTEEDVKVVTAIPELGVQDTSYINSVDQDESKSSDEMLLRIPANAKSGVYDVVTTVTFNDGDDRTTATTQITVVGDSQAAQSVPTNNGNGYQPSGTSTISVGMQEQSLAAGQNGVVYPLTVVNGEAFAKTFTFAVSGAQDWATVKLSPSNVVVLNPGETKQVYVYVAASENAAPGAHVFSVDVSANNAVVQQIPLKADVLASAAGTSWDGVKKALTIGVVLLVVLILVLGIVVLYQRKFKSADNKVAQDEQIAQTYY